LIDGIYPPSPPSLCPDWVLAWLLIEIVLLEGVTGAQAAFVHLDLFSGSIFSVGVPGDESRAAVAAANLERVVTGRRLGEWKIALRVQSTFSWALVRDLSLC
jgi:hypothetical protein